MWIVNSGFGANKSQPAAATSVAITIVVRRALVLRLMVVRYVDA